MIKNIYNSNPFKGVNFTFIMAEKELTDYQINILECIVFGSIEAISYHKPQKQLEAAAKNFYHQRKVTKNKNLEKTQEALSSLEKDFDVLTLDPTLRFGIFNKCGYRVDLDKARNLYESCMERNGE
jgi:hypothetical protein